MPRKSWLDRLSVDAASAVLGVRESFAAGELECSAASLARSIKSHTGTDAAVKTIQEWICQVGRKKSEMQ